MKKIILISIVLIIIPCLIIINFNGAVKKHLFFESNNTIRVLRNKTNQIEIIPFEEYIVGVLAGEMPVYFDIEALKAQALASRSYAYKKIQYNKNKNYDVIDTTANQVYLDRETLKKSWGNDYLKNIEKLEEAVSTTKDEYIVYNNNVIDAFFFSTSTGITENSENVFGNEVPYLKSVSSTWDEISPVYRVKKEYTLLDFYKKLNISKTDILKVEYKDITSTGKVNKIIINNKEFKGSEIVNILSLKSQYFIIEQNNDKIIVTTSGYGHGVGMSQYGAYAMAKKGYTYDEIVKYYYQGTEIKKI